MTCILYTWYIPDTCMSYFLNGFFACLLDLPSAPGGFRTRLFANRLYFCDRKSCGSQCRFPWTAQPRRHEYVHLDLEARSLHRRVVVWVRETSLRDILWAGIGSCEMLATKSCGNKPAIYDICIYTSVHVFTFMSMYIPVCTTSNTQ